MSGVAKRDKNQNDTTLHDYFLELMTTNIDYIIYSV